MIIEVLRDKYCCNSQKGITCINHPGLLKDLNKIIEWDKSTFPLKPGQKLEIEQVSPGVGCMSGDTLKKILDENNGELTEEAVMNFYLNNQPKLEEDRHFLDNKEGKPELKPGDMFMTGASNQVIACDSEDKLVLCISESGPLALNRIYEKTILKELEYIDNDTIGNITETCIVEGENNNYTKSKKLTAREKEILGSGKKLEVELSCLPGYKIGVIYSGEEILYSPEDIDEDCIKSQYLIQGIVSWYFKKNKGGN